MVQAIMEKINAHPVYKQILSDSLGGLLYNVDNQGTYDTSELLPMMEEVEPHNMNGIMKGAYNFITE